MRRWSSARKILPTQLKPFASSRSCLRVSIDHLPRHLRGFSFPLQVQRRYVTFQTFA